MIKAIVSSANRIQANEYACKNKFKLKEVLWVPLFDEDERFRKMAGLRGLKRNQLIGEFSDCEILSLTQNHTIGFDLANGPDQTAYVNI